jgi:hypothetical protein
MRQSSQVTPALPAFLLAALCILGGAAESLAQDRYRVIRTENLRREPSGRAALLATVNAGVELTGEGEDGRWVQVALEGWLWVRSLDSTVRDGFDVVVTPSGGENLRAEPNGRILARVSAGALFEEVDREPGWVRVRRVAWMFGPSLERLGGQAESTGPATGGTAGSPDMPVEAAVLDDAATTAATVLYRTPDGDSTGLLETDIPVRILARSGEWVRIQTEAWVRASDVSSAPPGVLVGVSGAEVRARPGEYAGKLVQWTLQFIAVQSPDEVRRDIPEGSRYMLTRGPMPETGFVYVVLTTEQARQLERQEPLSELVIIGRVRTGRSHYLGNPVLTLVEVASR